jgi:hypothetical protein
MVRFLNPGLDDATITNSHAILGLKASAPARTAGTHGHCGRIGRIIRGRIIFDAVILSSVILPDFLAWFKNGDWLRANDRECPGELETARCLSPFLNLDFTRLKY